MQPKKLKLSIIDKEGYHQEQLLFLHTMLFKLFKSIEAPKSYEDLNVGNWVNFEVLNFQRNMAKYELNGGTSFL